MRLREGESGFGSLPSFTRECVSPGMWGGFGNDYKFVSAAESLVYNLPYPLVALLLVARMWRAHPFER
jgi:hypothetical protein